MLNFDKSPKTINQPHLKGQVKLLQKAALIHQEKVLLLRRSKKEVNRPNCWDLPGGNVEWPVELKELSLPIITGLHRDGLAREIAEETSLEIEPKDIAHSNLVFFETTFQPKENIFTIITGWSISLDKDRDQITPKLSSEHDLYEWINPEQVQDYDFGYAKFIPEIIQAAWNYQK